MLETNQIVSDVIETPVIRLSQKGITLYISKMKAVDLLLVWEIDKFREEHLEGYQRKTYVERAKEIAKYIVECPIAVLPAVFVSLRENYEYIPSTASSEIGILRIPKKKGSIWIIDGMHRLAAFEVVVNTNKDEKEKYQCIFDYYLPTVFIESKKAAEVISGLTDKKLQPEDIEQVLFFIINKTAKSISPSLKDALAYKIISSGIRGIPIIERSYWRTIATSLTLRLINDHDSPLKSVLKITGIEHSTTRGLKRTVTLNTFVSSLKPLVKDNIFFKQWDYEKQIQFLKVYWSILKQLFPEASSNPRKYLIHKSIGIYILNRLASDILTWLAKKGKEIDRNVILQNLRPLRDVSWETQDSPLAAFGGMKGVQIGYKLVLKRLADRDIAFAKDALEMLQEDKKYYSR